MKCPTCKTKCEIDIEPFEYSYFWCPKCKKKVKKFLIN